MHWLSQDEKKGSVVLLDLEVDALDQSTIHFDLNVIFKHIPVTRGIVQVADFYVGTCGGEVSIEFKKGIINDYTNAKILKVDYCNTNKRTRKSSFSLRPKVDQNDKASLEIGSLSWSAGTEREFTTTFTSEESEITPIQIGNEVQWVISRPRGDKAIYDFLIGNLYLFAECSWPCAVRRGEISVKPSNICFFDSEKRKIGKLNSLAMLYSLWQQGIHFRNEKGLKIAFRYEDG